MAGNKKNQNLYYGARKMKSNLRRRSTLSGFWGERRKWEQISQRLRAQMTGIMAVWSKILDKQKVGKKKTNNLF